MKKKKNTNLFGVVNNSLSNENTYAFLWYVGTKKQCEQMLSTRYCEGMIIYIGDLRRFT